MACHQHPHDRKSGPETSPSRHGNTLPCCCCAPSARRRAHHRSRWLWCCRHRLGLYTCTSTTIKNKKLSSRCRLAVVLVLCVVACFYSDFCFFSSGVQQAMYEYVRLSQLQYTGTPAIEVLLVLAVQPTRCTRRDVLSCLSTSHPHTLHFSHTRGHAEHLEL